MTDTQDRMVEYDGCGETLRVYESGKIERFMGKTETSKKWKVVKMKPDPDRGYCRIGINKKGYRAHRIIYAAFNEAFDINGDKVVEHINGLGNNLSNLREANCKTNDNKSQKGYYFIKNTNKWAVSINLGSCENEEAAKEAAEVAKDLLGLNDEPGLWENYEQALADLKRVTEELQELKYRITEQYYREYQQAEGDYLRYGYESQRQDFNKPDPLETVCQKAREDFLSDWKWQHER